SVMTHHSIVRIATVRATPRGLPWYVPRRSSRRRRCIIDNASHGVELPLDLGILHPVGRSAVNHAFAHLGLTHTQMPHDHWRVWKTARASDLPRVEPRSPKPSIANTASNASEWPGSAYEVSNHCRSRAEPEVRIHFPPAQSQQQTGSDISAYPPPR